MSKEKLVTLLDAAWDNGNPFIDHTNDYVYALIPMSDGNWNEVSFDLQGGELDERTISSGRAFRMLIEELEKGISMELEDFMLGDFRTFRNSLGDKSDDDKIKSIIDEIVGNSEKYSVSLPVVKSKDGLDAIKSKL